MGERPAEARRAARIVLPLLLLLVALQLLVAQHRGLFGDEAFYAACARRPALSYADHPFMTASLVRAGVALLGAQPLGARLFFVALSAVVPLLLGLLALRLGASRAGAWGAAAAVLALPLLGVVGTLAVPDVPLLVFSLGALLALIRAARLRRARDGALAGLLMALALSTHLRGALVPLSALVGLASTRAGRDALRSRAAVVAALVGLLGLAPLAHAEWSCGGGTLAYQLADRHAQSAAGWSGLGEFVLGQIVAVCTPLVFVLLCVALRRLVRGAREGRLEHGLALAFALVPLGLFLVASPFSDADHASQHWTLPGWAVLLAALPMVVPRWLVAGGWRRGLVALGLLPAALLGLALLVVARTESPELKLLQRKFAGWDAAAARTVEQLSAAGAADASEPWLVAADHYVLAAQLEFALSRAGLDRHEVFVLRHRKNEDHGRASQYALWERDEAALLARHGARVLVVLELSATGRREHEAHRQRIRDLLSVAAELDALSTGFPGDELLLEWWAARVP